MEQEQQAAEVKEQSGTDTAQSVQEEVIPKARFNQVYWKAKQAERENLALQQKIAALEQKPAELKPPSLEDFDYDEDRLAKAKQAYQDKLVEQRINQAVEQKFQTISKSKEAAERINIENKFLERSAEYAANNPDYVEATNSAQGVEINQTASDIILNSPNGPALHHYLLTNPDVLEKINSIQNPGLIGAEIGRMESRLNLKQHSNAPDPINPGQGGAALKKTVYDENLSMEEFYRIAYES